MNPVKLENYIEEELGARYIFYTFYDDPHGECWHFYDEWGERPWTEKFYYYKKLHGEYLLYSRKGVTDRRTFYYFGDEFKLPFLPPKPPQRGHRFNSLEFL